MLKLPPNFSSVVAVVSAALLCSCASTPRHYQPPDPSRLKASTARVSKAVDDAHLNAKKAQAGVSDLVNRQNEIKAEISKLKDVPPTLLQKIKEQDAGLKDVQISQVVLEKNFTDADKAKADVEKDKTDYFGAAQKLANDAGADSQTKADTINKQSKTIWWYRLHFFLGWIILITGIAACALVAFLKFTGRLAAAGAVIASKVP